MIRFLTFLLICCIVAALCSCAKPTIEQPDGKFQYQMVVDWHSLDTTILYYRYTQDLGLLKEADVKTWREMWYIDCNMLDRLQHLYYRKIEKQ